jgi:DNA polymerase-3 subunit alpha
VRDSLLRNDANERSGGAFDGAFVALGCSVTKVRSTLDRPWNRMAFIELEDFTGTMEAIVFSEPLQNFGQHLAIDSMVLVGGTLSFKDEAEPKLILERAIPLDQVVEKIAIG